VVARLNDKDRIFEFYSREKIESAEAKRAYLLPDLHPPAVSDQQQGSHSETE
jgi:hypothetical protein